MTERISPCPKRVMEGGIIGTTDLGPCLIECAACIVDEKGYFCKEYGNHVRPKANAHTIEWPGWNYAG